MKYPSHGYRWLNAKIRLDILKEQKSNPMAWLISGKEYEKARDSVMEIRQKEREKER